MGFELDKQLEKDTVPLLQLKLCTVRLMNDSQYPWLIMVPQRESCVEIIDLSIEEQQVLLAEIRACSQVLKSLYPNCKLNVANLGNVVSQLHIHVIARHIDDKAWPKPVWGVHPPIPYDQAVLQSMTNDIKAAIAGSV